ncbi:mitogen-activated protein kinase kinase 10 [Rosa rugosa]|uniref:mitogen-activated protein kinase kinase 10 n=1 Tax=Rosa rugosa TaxID=74645 RepID=UPI002B417FBB|nr:mitogen-activated protein kinase kinase 10 [Rosa rugosa]
MTLVRERRHQQGLRLSPPPPPVTATADFTHRSFFPALSPASSPDSPAIIENLSDLEKVEVLGHGDGGTVYKVRHKKSSCIYALKVLRFDNNAATGILQQVAREAEILKLVDSPYVIRCHGIFDSGAFMSPDHSNNEGGGDLCFVMEYMEGGSLHDVLRARQRLPEQLISRVAKCVLQGLRYLHAMQIVHRDIKPSNLLINGRGEIKIADFGVSHMVAGAHEACDLHMGTYAYMSPERFDPERWGGRNADGFAGDVWSLGLVVLQCYVGRFPLIGPGQKPDWPTLMCVICFGERLEMPETATPEFRSFIWRCLEKDWRKRAKVDELLDHPFVNKTCCASTDQELVNFVFPVD